MPSPELDRLVDIGQLKLERPSRTEFDGLLKSGGARLDDASNTDNSLPSRFDLAYNAAHAFALAALRRLGYRSEHRYTVFQVIPHTLGLDASTWRLLAKCHALRNQGEYEGLLDLDDRLVEDLIDAAQKVRDAVQAVDPP